MDKVNGNPTARNFAERAMTTKGHRSAVERALKAHREQSTEREVRTQSRIDRNLLLQNKTPSLITESGAPMTLENLEQPLEVIDPGAQFVNNEDRENFYSELQIASSKDNAIASVEKEKLNPEKTPSDEIPKGSYVDFTV